MTTSNDFDNLIRDLTSVTPMPKSEARRRINRYVEELIGEDEVVPVRKDWEELHNGRITHYNNAQERIGLHYRNELRAELRQALRQQVKPSQSDLLAFIDNPSTINKAVEGSMDKRNQTLKAEDING